MMPMFRVRLSGVSLGIEISFQLPAVSFQLRSYPDDRFFSQPAIALTAGSWELEAGS
jgi:hypothetical protein